MEQQPASLEPKASATVTSAIPPTRYATPWPNTVLASTNLFVARSWLIPPNRNDIPAPDMHKMKRPDAENAPPKQAAIPCPMVLGNSAPNNNETSLPIVPSEELCTWGPQCPVCVQSSPDPEPDDSDWEDQDWDGDIQKAKREEKQRKEDKLRRKLAAKQCTDNYYPPSPQYRLSYEENPLNIQGRSSHNYKTEQGRRERLELLNDKYNLDYYSESDSESEHEYITLV